MSRYLTIGNQALPKEWPDCFSFAPMAIIKTTTVLSTLTEGGETKPTFERTFEEYNPQGKLVLSVERDAEGKELHREEYAYDGEGRKTREHKHFVSEEMEETHRWEYDEQGEVVREISEYVGGFETVKHLDRQPGKIVVKVTDEDGTPEGREERTLDAEGRVVEVVEYDEEDTLKAHLVTEYDAAGRKVREETRSWDDSFVQEWMYVYDEEGRLMEEKELNEEGYIILLRKHEYDEKGQLIAYSAEDLIRKEKVLRSYAYNEQGQLVEESRIRGEVPEATSQYEYNAEGKIIKQTITTPFFEAVNEYQYTYHPE